MRHRLGLFLRPCPQLIHESATPDDHTPLATRQLSEFVLTS
jgi:hypothetical protein